MLGDPIRRRQAWPATILAVTTEPIPVVAGVAAVSHAAQRPHDAVDCAELLCTAATAAIDDSGAPGLAAQVGEVLVTRGLSKLEAGAGRIAAELGVPEATAVAYEPGVAQQTLINRAIQAVQAGSVRAVLVAGAEAKRSDDLARRAGIDGPARAPFAGPADQLIAPAGELVARPEIAVGAVAPVIQYAMIDSARRAAAGWSVDEHRDEIASLWAGFNAVARANPAAAFAAPMTAAEIREPSPGNRLLAFPYNKWHSTQWSVDQAAAFVVTSAEAADALGIDPERRVFPWAALESSHQLSLSRRARLHRWPAMALLGETAERHLGRGLRTLDHTELYSCFPAAVRVQQAELDLDMQRPATITGGMAFAGGPFNSFVLQSTAAMLQRLRAEPGSVGMVTGISGFLTKPGLSVYSTAPPPQGALIGDIASGAEKATGVAALAPDPDGEGLVAGYTVVPVDGEPLRVIAIVDLEDGRRAVASADDADIAAQAMRTELIGTRARVQAQSLML